MTDDEITKARTLIAAASPGPWTFESPQPPAGAVEIYRPMRDEDDMNLVADWVPESDAAFICAAREGWPAALDALEKARFELRDWREYGSDVENERDASHADAKALRTACRNLQDDLDATRTVLAEATTDLAIARAQRDTALLESDGLRAECDALRIDLEDARRDAARTHGALDITRTHLDGALDDLETAVKELAVVRATHEARITELADAMDAGDTERTRVAFRQLVEDL